MITAKLSSKGQVTLSASFRVSSLFWASTVWLLLPHFVASQTVVNVKALYTKHEHQIPMRDGTKLFTIVYTPKDQSQKHPIMLQRTPYSVRPYGAEQYAGNLGPSPLFASDGYIFAYQDVRGRWMSEGQFEDMRPQIPNKKSPQDIDESSDTWDTIDWLVKNVPNSNGNVGLWGISYVGFYAGVGMVDAHPALKAASPQAPQTDWFMGDDVHHNGALFLHQEFNFDVFFGWPRPKPTSKFERRFDFRNADAYDFFLRMGPLPQANEKYLKNQIRFWNDVMDHGSYDDFWKARNLLPHLKDIRPAVLTVGGWFDAEDLYGALQMFRQIEAHSPATKNHLVMGPWFHGGWSRSDGSSLGPVQFDAKTSIFFREKIEFPFFQYYLKGIGEIDHPKAWVFETGRNQWHRHENWPPKEARPKSVYLSAGGKLSFDPPSDASAEAFDEYTSDPEKPVPYTDVISIQYPRTYMIEDQRFAARRPDVLVYQTDDLEKDITFVGPVEAALHVATSGTDADWVVKLIDVYPNNSSNPSPNPTRVRMGGYQQLVRGDVMRGKFRKSFEKPEPFEPDVPDAVNFTMQDIYHTFRAGHRIMVQVQSSWFPLVDRNPQKFVDIYHATAGDFQKARQRVFRSGPRPSQLKLLVLEQK
jgi:putative CocE/NonD family hydrolase